MDEINQNVTQNIVTENPYAPAPQPVVVSQPVSTNGVVYATFFERLVAMIIDAVLVGFASGAISAIFSSMGDFGQTLGSLVTGLLAVAYYVYFISQKGQTLGKKALNLRVQNESTGQNLDVVSAILREVVGKFISGMVLLIGYFWMLGDSKKQTWHDKIAKSVVVKIK